MSMHQFTGINDDVHKAEQLAADPFFAWHNQQTIEVKRRIQVSASLVPIVDTLGTHWCYTISVFVPIA